MNVNKLLGVEGKLNGNILEIPIDKLETAGISEDSKVEIFSNEYYVFIRQAEQFCDTCGGNNGVLTEIGNMKLCHDCLQKINDAANSAK